MVLETEVILVPSVEEKHEFFDTYMDRDTGNYHLDFILPAHMVNIVRQHNKEDDPRGRAAIEYVELMVSALNNGIISIITEAYNGSHARGTYTKNGIKAATDLALSVFNGFDMPDKSKVN